MSIFLDDLIGQVFSLFVLTVAAAESSIGLAILVAFFRTRGSITIYNSDGGEVSACGNGARCVAYLLSENLNIKKIQIKTKNSRTKRRSGRRLGYKI